MIQAVLFDLDGVLVDTYRSWFALVQETARHFGAPEVTEAVFRGSWGQSIEDDTELFVPGVPVPEVAAYYDRRFRSHLPQLTVTADAGETLDALGRAGVRTACVTNSPASAARDILEAAGLAGRLDAVLTADDVKRPKPAPDLVVLACGRLQVAADRALLVGDSRFDEQAAAAAGVRFVHFDTTRGGRLGEALRAAGVRSEP